ncbi:hypothetical protein VST7929_01159 [Vibrio stylophorae]|uniref:Transcriptional regulator n=2 Tax=Vibrio stylophorae TaxID=659351 RepID=A0ABM8ZSK6_9VIBR|nr:hypothetical protein VST7929_01159 [Vibrio stylophorae]
MDATTSLIFVAIFAWVLQIAFGFLQVRAFNKMLQKMAKQGQVKIGRTQSRWKPRTLLVMVEDTDGVIIEAKALKGMTVFARPRTVKCLLGQRYPFAEQVINQLDKGTREALTVAFSH